MKLHARQRGYILVLASFLLAGILLGSLSVVRLAQQSQDQLHVQHVADHAAQALATIAARDLNFKAITNRAMLANEIAIGQLLGINSWFMMTQQATQNIALLTSWVPYLNAITKAMNQVVKQAEKTLSTGIEAAVLAQQTMLKGLEAAQVAFHQASWTSSLFTVTDLVEASHPDYEVALLNHQTLLDLNHLWLKFQTRSSNKKQQAQYADLASESRDPFSYKRTYRWFKAFNLRVNKGGGSEISERSGQVVWQAIDTMSIHVNTLFGVDEVRFAGGAYYLRQRLPLRNKNNDYGQSYRVNPKASRNAARRARQIRHRHRVPYQYLLNDAEKYPSVTLVVRRPETDEQPMIWGVGRAKITFKRDNSYWPRGDLMRERKNLFNALWRVQPSSVNELERQLIGAQV
ncbi:hypothetical protein [Aliidiomarina celeris]|uniref:hypothetical protein n=1 Tax=Aliidiomarina celeris TaxID=2249428 RepID=UPI000DE84954|nr:hypothetical protein [Aliidiomarina celeris]